MQSQDWIEVKYKNIQESLKRRVDFQSQKLDGKDLDERQKELLLLLQAGVPCGSASYESSFGSSIVNNNNSRIFFVFFYILTTSFLKSTRRK